jgi:Ricin-type beta-trefoil lectin domain
MPAIHGEKLMAKYIFLIGLLVVALVACTTSSVLVPGNSNECMVLPEHGYVADGTQVRILHCHGAANQQWNFTNGQITGIGGSCLDVQGGAANDGARVIAVNCSGAPSQQWNISNGRVVGIGGKCLDVLEGNLFDRAPLIISTCTGAPSQQWAMH